ncbi:MAG: phenylalanine--tRNA ligase subunit beta [Myxococcales bacterium]|nr:phenylalanine--tRNA ligase subunit beta [Myxococcales bacterium]
MRVPLGWLAEWIELPASQQELTERLTLGGLEIEGIENTGPDLSALRVGHVLERKPHPKADRLSLCQVDLGDGEPLEIVCGAANVAAGQKVAVASAGAVLPDGTKLKRTKIRGVVSQGMICSAQELRLGEGHSGILVLDPETPVGVPLGTVLSAGQTVIDFEITPNRGDWASMLGIAREVRAHFGGSIHWPELDVLEGERETSTDISVEIDDAAGCYSYVARIVRGVRLGFSPGWLCEKLEAVGMRPINLVVDVTNLVLLELGQPLHAFDLGTLRGGVIRVRGAAAGEKIVTLDGTTRALVTDDLVIADAERAIAIAGVMGGAETEVREDTTDLLIESAHFDPSRVRRTARRLGLHTEASYRFERGVDREGIGRAADRCARLLAELAGGEISRGRVVARGGTFPATSEVVLDPERMNRLLGTSLSVEQVVALLARLEIRASLDGDGHLRCAIPSHRNDVHLPQDVIEEVARIYGYDRLPTTLPVCELSSATRPGSYLLSARVRDSLCASGLLETMTFPGFATADLDALGLPDDDSRRRTVQILNPITEHESQLCTSLVPALLRSTRQNLARQVDRVRLFELGRVFSPGEEGQLPDERIQVVAVITRGERRQLWEPREAAPLFFEARGIAERVLSDQAVSVEFRAGAGEPYLHPGASGQLVAAGRTIASVGELHPKVAHAFEIEEPCALLEIDLEAVEALPSKLPQYHEVSRQPAVRRDIAVLLTRDCPAGEVLAAIRKTGGAALVSVDLFDRYEGEGIPEDKVSMAVRLVFQRPDRTLEDAEIRRMTERVVQMLAHRFGGEQR